MVFPVAEPMGKTISIMGSSLNAFKAMGRIGAFTLACVFGLEKVGSLWSADLFYQIIHTRFEIPKLVVCFIGIGSYQMLNCRLTYAQKGLPGCAKKLGVIRH